MECPHGSLHLTNHNIYFELLNPETLEAVAPGELGEVVITELHSRLMPFLRYRVGDLARISARPCSCGLASPTIESLEGRVTALIHTPSGRRLSSYLVSYCMPQEVDRYLTIQRSVHFLEILVTAQAQVSAQVKEDMISRIRREIGEDIRVEVKQVDDIPREKSGKLRAFVSELGDDSANLQ
jgi:phenylacetate-CoA ligase